MGPTLAEFLRGYPRRSAVSDSDPDEVDIEEHLHPGPGFGFGGSRSPSSGERRREADANATFQRFAEMLMNDLGAGRILRGGPLGSGLFPAEENFTGHGGTRIQQTTVRSGPFGSHTSITITSGSTGGSPEIRGSLEGSPPNPVTYVTPRRENDTHHPGGPRIRAIAVVNSGATNATELHRLIDQLFGNPWGMGETEEFAGRERGFPNNAAGAPLLGGLQELLNSLYNPANAVHGDAVFTQEALDRIITQLMEASPQTNAAPPASESAIQRLEKKKVDDEMLGPEGKAECTICIDEIKKGDEVTVLPCKHWYHGDCVVLWLKEHNTCPICRMPIENREGGTSNNNNININNSNDNNSGNRYRRHSEHRSQRSEDRHSSGSLFGNPLAPRPRPERERDRQRGPRSMQENMERFNAIRNLAGAGTRSNSQRRSSHSPPGAFPTSDFDDTSRTRFRSPSNSRDWARYRDGERDQDTEMRGSPWDDGWFGYGSGGFGESGRRHSPQNQNQGSGQRGTFSRLWEQFGRRG